MRVQHNLGSVGPQLRAAAEGVEPAVRRGLRRIGIAVERQASKNTSGQGGPGAYPIPRRTGFLNRSISGPILTRDSVAVESTAAYSAAITFGFHAFGNRNAPYYPGRPYMFLAAQSVDAPAILLEELEPVL